MSSSLIRRFELQEILWAENTLSTQIEGLRGPIQQDEEGKVTNVFFLNEAHGSIVSVRQKRRLYHLPLYALQAPYTDAQTQ